MYNNRISLFQCIYQFILFVFMYEIQARQKNEELRKAAEEKKKEMERKRLEEDRKQEEKLKKQLEERLKAAKAKVSCSLFMFVITSAINCIL